MSARDETKQTYADGLRTAAAEADNASTLFPDNEWGAAASGSMEGLAIRLRRMAGEAEEKADAPAAVTGEAYDGEFAMLRTLVRTLRVAARHDDLAALKQAITNHTTDDAAARAQKSSPTGPDAADGGEDQ